MDGPRKKLNDLEFHLRIALHNKDVLQKRVDEWDDDIYVTKAQIEAAKEDIAKQLHGGGTSK